MYRAQHKVAVEWLSLSLENFVAFGRQMGDPAARVVHLANTGRCGSTLLARMLAKGGCGRLISMSEPDFITHLQDMQYLDQLRTLPVSLADLVLAGFRVQCKPAAGLEDASCFLIKTRGGCVSFLPEISTAAPFVKQCFMYSDPLKSIASFLAVEKTLEDANYISDWFSLEKLLEVSRLLPPVPAWPTTEEEFAPLIVANDDPAVAEAVWRQIRARKEEAQGRKHDELNFWSFFIALHVLAFARSRVKGVEVATVAYEDLMTSPEEVLEPLLAACGIPSTAVPDCLEAMVEDSQEQSLFNQVNMRKHKRGPFSRSDLDKINDIFQDLGLPRVEEYKAMYIT